MVLWSGPCLMWTTSISGQAYRARWCLTYCLDVCWFIYSFVCVKCVYLFMCAFVCVHMKARPLYQVSSSLTLHLMLFKTVSLLNPELVMSLDLLAHKLLGCLSPPCLPQHISFVRHWVWLLKGSENPNLGSRDCQHLTSCVVLSPLCFLVYSEIDTECFIHMLIFVISDTLTINDDQCLLASETVWGALRGNTVGKEMTLRIRS